MALAGRRTALAGRRTALAAAALAALHTSSATAAARPPSRPARHAAAAAPSVAASFDTPVVAHATSDGVHSWFSSIMTPLSKGGDAMVMTLSQGGDGTPCPPPGKTQNCSCTLTSDDGGKSWAPISDWSKHSMNEALHYDDGEGTFFALGYRAENGPGNRTAANVGWKGRLSAEGGIEVLEAGVKVSFDAGCAGATWPEVIVHSGSVVRLDERTPGVTSHLTTLYGHGPGVYPHFNPHSAVYFVNSSDHGVNWSLRSFIPWKAAFGDGDGPGEPTTTRLADGRLLCVFRANARAPYWKAFSSDEGHTWTDAVQMPTQWSVRPLLTVLPDSGLVVLTGGRPGINLWASADGGEEWARFNIAEKHNEGIKAAGGKEALLYVPAVVAVNSSASPMPSPPQSTSYTGAAVAADGTLVISYDRLANGWSGPPGVYGDVDMTFTMRVRLSVSS